jgi:hypothetical protein
MRINERFETMDDCMVPILRAKTSAERLAIAHGMWRFARDTIIAVLRKQYPDWTDRQIQRELARRISHGAA